MQVGKRSSFEAACLNKMLPCVGWTWPLIAVYSAVGEPA